ncbi:MAG: DUF4097 family beta strand repeat-containing protein [Acidobacteriota bacterium]|jgi:DUF4097 and DUF4098 domain-containing protein YvlB
MRLFRQISIILAVLAASVTLVAAQEWDLGGVDRIVLEGVSGDVVIRPGGNRVELRADVRPSSAFQANVEQDGSTLRLQEDWSGGSASGDVTWTFYLSGPGTAVQIQTASGDLDAEDVSLDIDFHSASGDIELDRVELAADSELKTASGDFILGNMTLRRGAQFTTASGDVKLDQVDVEEDVTLTTASGDVRVKRSRGVLNLTSASGDVIISDSTVQDGSRFSSASGDVSLSLDQLPSSGLSATSASGDVVLDAGKLGGNYTLILIADAKKGEIRTPFQYTSERTFRKHDRDYMEKRVDFGSGGPELTLETASGNVVVRR